MGNTEAPIMEESAGKFAAAVLGSISSLNADGQAMVKAEFVKRNTDEGKAELKKVAVKSFEANSTDGKMDLAGFKAYLAYMFQEMPQPPADSPEAVEVDLKMTRLFAAVDTDNDGALDQDEVAAFMSACMQKIVAGVEAL